MPKLAPALQMTRAPITSNPVEAVKTELGYLADVDVDIQYLWDIVGESDFTTGDLPLVLIKLMVSIRCYKVPGWVKKEVVVAVLRTAIERTNQPAAVIDAMKHMVPHLLDGFFCISKKGARFKPNKNKKLTGCFN